MGEPEETIYVELLAEGIPCWRAVQAERVSSDTYRITTTRPPDETWAFQPGEVVRCRDLVAGESVTSLPEL